MGFISNKKRLYRVLTAVLVFLSISFSVCGQALRGTTGLLHAPTADMQQDKTFMLGGNVLDITPLHYYDFDVRYTFNYYLNITVFPWLEVGYTCTIRVLHISRSSRGGNTPIRTGLSISVFVSGKRDGGKRGLRRS